MQDGGKLEKRARLQRLEGREIAHINRVAPGCLLRRRRAVMVDEFWLERQAVRLHLMQHESPRAQQGVDVGEERLILIERDEIHLYVDDQSRFPTLERALEDSDLASLPVGFA